jgi:hypothetical protein
LRKKEEGEEEAAEENPIDFYSKAVFGWGEKISPHL